jgi:hypothetical protein
LFSLLFSSSSIILLYFFYFPNNSTGVPFRFLSYCISAFFYFYICITLFIYIPFALSLNDAWWAFFVLCNQKRLHSPLTCTYGKIPQDIIDKIIAEVGDDTRLLKQCSLVSSSFLLPSRRQLFSRITLSDDQACQRIWQNFSSKIHTFNPPSEPLLLLVGFPEIPLGWLAHR